MTVSTQGMKVNWGSRSLRASVELLSSMRFSISLLTVICIASIIGTVLKQAEPLANYVNQFGPFWAQVFSLLSLNTVYSAWWFLLILAFLVISTSLCIARNAPKIFADLNQLKENVREQSLKAFGHRAEAALAESPEAAACRIGQTLVQSGWKVKLQQRQTAGGGGWMVAAKKGAANKLGYIAAHSAIVLVCIGGLLDGDMVVRAQMWLNDKSIYSGGGLIADVPVQHRLSDRNPTFRANLLVAEGTQSGTAILNQPGGVLLQELPFSIELKKFIVEYYSTGMPKLFASDIIIHDKETGEKIPARVEVNHPASHRGIEIYQSSFDDGGSSVTLKAIPMAAASKPFEIQGTIGGTSQLTNGQGEGAEKLTLEYTALRVINVENFASGGSMGSGADVRKVDLHQAIDTRLGAANKTVTQKELRNVGPSVSYKLRDAAGQAREFHNYMLPVKTDQNENAPAVYLLGVRETPSAPFQYLRIPVDPEGSMDTFLRLRAALANPAQRELAVRRYASQAIGRDRPELAQQLAASASRALALFAGSAADATPAGVKTAGLQAISDFMEANVPEAERSRAGEVLVRILNGVLFELAQMTREQAGLKPLGQDDKTLGFMSQMVLSLSDAHFYPAPMAFELKDFTQVQASVFQVARAPGKTIVYLGCAFLILGVFAMLYVRERRVWVWLAPRGASAHGAPAEGASVTESAEDPAHSHATMALSTNRKTMDGDKEFEMLKTKLLQAPL
ncbi:MULTISPECIES: cytochrome c biogenesis protein ResB [unclassified Polaromonas]|uniref:cytochrome c biogenesis protein ResB n=1 Tax=unclassified Polaromonas TaxID=2638319 RepID=UPI000F0872E7|nr:MULTISPECIES: cytochrome c biogenesis protein ResB [unclassified Polaromonas]AYQ28352.1 cytochrome c biogenesis protein ResB [Polaromonas sp. SP1]QGJ20527.1 cytochrome c biogenesis protein ResB [Polaromonas sp. Pch-P]